MEKTDSPTPEPVQTATPAKEPVSIEKGTAQVSETARVESAEPNDTFTSIDVKTLTPELKSKYDAMLTDYKKKTTEVAQIRKDAESRYKEVQDVIQNPDFQKAYQTLTSPQKAEVREEIGITEDDFNRAFENKDNFAGFIQKVARASSSQSQQEMTNLKASLAVKDFKTTHPEFEKFNKHGFITYQLKTDPRAQGNDERQWAQALTDAYVNAERVHNELVEEGKRQGLERIQQKVQASTEPPTGSVPQVYPGGDPKKLTTSEAIALARRGIRVPMNA